MNVLIASDSFKGSLTSVEAGNAIAEGIKSVFADADITVCPMADGGEGTAYALAEAGGRMQSVKVHDPAGRLIDAYYGISADGGTAIIEAASACGLTLISKSEQAPMHTTTYGLGEMIIDAVKRNIRNFIVGLGGSATNDGGIGMLAALGFGLTDLSGNDVPFGAAGLKDICTISDDGVPDELKACRFNVACDVKNPLFGPDGCSRIFAPQKGATEQEIEVMDKWMMHYADVVKKYRPQSDAGFSGAGAAGGLGFAFMTFLNATLQPGAEMIMRLNHTEEHIKNADIVITGEGKLDGQTKMGKVPYGVASLAKKYHKPVIAFAGCLSDDAAECNKLGIDAFFSILSQPCSEKDAMDQKNAYVNLKNTVQQVFGLIGVSWKTN